MAPKGMVVDDKHGWIPLQKLLCRLVLHHADTLPDVTGLGQHSMLTALLVQVPGTSHATTKLGRSPAGDQAQVRCCSASRCILQLPILLQMNSHHCLTFVTMSV